jgi:hypothetical protein
VAVQSAGVPEKATKVELSSQSLIDVATKLGAGYGVPSWRKELSGLVPAESLIQGFKVTGLLYSAEPVSMVAEGAGGGTTVIVIVE